MLRELSSRASEGQELPRLKTSCFCCVCGAFLQGQSPVGRFSVLPSRSLANEQHGVHDAVEPALVLGLGRLHHRRVRYWPRHGWQVEPVVRRRLTMSSTVASRLAESAEHVERHKSLLTCMLRVIALVGFVPCADLGMMHTFRCPCPMLSRYS